MFEAQQKQIKDSLNTPLTSRSWLILGPRGVGKKEFAEAIVRELTGRKQSYNPCVKWVQCNYTETAQKEIQKAILAGEIPEAKEWARRTEITVEDVQEATHFLALKSDTIKILIFNLADDMNENAQNALLKTLEEPYPSSLILLLSENPGHLLPTIISRCQKVHLLPPTPQEFEKIVRQKYPELSNDELMEVGFLSNYIVGTAEKILQFNGLDFYHELNQLLDVNSSLNSSELIAFAERVSDKKEVFQMITASLLMNVHSLSKQKAQIALGQAHDLSELYRRIKKQFDEVDSKNLDKKQNLISAILQVREAL